MNVIYQLLAWIMPTVSVDRAVSFLTKAATMLAAAEAAQNERARQLDDQIEVLRMEREDVVREAQRASRVAKNLQNLSA